ncbi:Holliday junction branch migration protein RuvA [Rhabdothermincola sediminis]|uniref:Holliday junction branch migration protein RuvA n=1 Tax=Rhabdothermincola sediminis TaxID=2751370 RepID=UPI001AA0AA10|nr:Holliday junction branch migration protein RuvA [Rhabdothermincola sediminis]
MIGSLRGTLVERAGDGELLVEVAGVGYRVTVTPTTVVEAGEPGDEVFLYVHHHRRDDVETLYGFLSREERACFEALIGAHGVGPALGLAILAVHSPPALQRVLADDDLAALCLVPGIGKKTAARLLVELKSRLDVPGLETAATASSDAGGGGRAARSARADVRDALANLGYAPDEVVDVVRELPDDGDPAELLKVALQRLAVG